MITTPGLEIGVDTIPGRVLSEGEYCYPLNDESLSPTHWISVSSSESWTSSGFIMCRLVLVIDNWQKPQTYFPLHFRPGEPWPVWVDLKPESGMLLFGSTSPWLLRSNLDGYSGAVRSAEYLYYLNGIYTALQTGLVCAGIADNNDYPIHLVDFLSPIDRGPFRALCQGAKLFFWQEDDLSHPIAQFDLPELLTALRSSN